MERAFARCYAPFLDRLLDTPQLFFNLHYSGCLLEWLEVAHPEFIKKLGWLVKRGQVELLLSGFYEPILTMIPPRDQVGQIEYLRAYLAERFGVKPEGLWLTERIWEPTLPSLLSKVGVKYTLLDDSIFRYAGVAERELYHAYLTEDQGKTVTVFPGSQKLRYTVPFREPAETIEWCRRLAHHRENELVVYADDGEKFGEWPGTEALVYGEGWLTRFFEALTREQSWLQTVKLSDFLQGHRPHRTVYFPTASYEELMTWALPVQAGDVFQTLQKRLEQQAEKSTYAPYLRGGYFRNFFTKYPESNQIHKHMLATSERFWELWKTGGEKKKSLLTEAQQELWKSQCNCGYWHGVFGGLYLNHIRSALYEHLIQADHLLDQVAPRRKQKVSFQVRDFDCDGVPEILAEDAFWALWISTARGGEIVEADAKELGVNMVNTVTRRPEAYHAIIPRASAVEMAHHASTSARSIHEGVQVQEAGLANLLTYDRHSRGLLREMIVAGEHSLADWAEGREGGCWTQAEELTWTVEAEREQVHFKKVIPTPQHLVKISKVIWLLGDGNWKVNYEVVQLEEAHGNEEQGYSFAVELNLSFPDGEGVPCLYSDGTRVRAGGMFETPGAQGVQFLPTRGTFFLNFSDRCRVSQYPVHTVSLSEQGVEKTFQGFCLVAQPLSPLTLSEPLRFSLLFSYRS